MSRLAIDMTAQTFGRLTVMERAESRGQKAMWLCRCSCGQTKAIAGGSLRQGLTRSCGCIEIERPSHTGHKKDVPTYIGAHARVYRERGKASYQGCADCSAPAAEWSYDGTDPDEMTTEKGYPYSGKPEHYSPRCLACHRAFDRV